MISNHEPRYNEIQFKVYFSACFKPLDNKTFTVLKIRVDFNFKHSNKTPQNANMVNVTVEFLVRVYDKPIALLEG